jgi:hypothetical protein
MAPSHDSPEVGSKSKKSRLREIARECWALACWLTLRQTWEQWEKQRAGSNTSGSPIALPPEVEAFFGRYAHVAYCRWAPVVSRSIVTRKERSRLKRQGALDLAVRVEQSSKSDEQDEEPKIMGAALQSGEELFGVLADEFDLIGSDDTSEDFFSTKSQRSKSQDVRLAFHDLQIEEPQRPQHPGDRAPWEAWHLTLQVLWEPRKISRRVLMNELFKQPLSKPSSTAGDMLRCLTGYLKTIGREAVRITAKEAIRTKEGSGESFAALDAAVPGSQSPDSFTGMDIVPSAEDTALSVMRAELKDWGTGVAQREFSAAISDGVRLSYFLESLKKSDGWKHGFVVSISEAAILSELRLKRSTLNDQIKKSRARLQEAARLQAIALGLDSCQATGPQAEKSRAVTDPLVEWLELCVKEIAVEWFWSEKIDGYLFGTVMDIIRTQHDPRFACPLASACSGVSSPSTESKLCQECPRK